MKAFRTGAHLETPGNAKLRLTCVRLFGGLSVEIGNWSTCPRKLLNEGIFFRPSPRIAQAGCGYLSAVTGCTDWQTAFGHPTVGIRIFQRPASYANLRIIWAACGLAIPRTSLRFWLTTTSKYLVQATV